jgi:hypothetical protein
VVYRESPRARARRPDLAERGRGAMFFFTIGLSFRRGASFFPPDAQSDSERLTSP